MPDSAHILRDRIERDETIESTLRGYDLNPLQRIRIEVFQKPRSEATQSIHGKVDAANEIIEPFGAFSN